MDPYYTDDMVTLYHGDCLEIDEWLDADVLVTDPPYGMAYVSGWMRQKSERVAVANDQTIGVRNAALTMWGIKPAAVFGTWRIARPDNTAALLIWHKAKVGAGMGDLSMPWGNSTEEIYILGAGWRGKRISNVIATYEQRGGANGLAAEVGHPTPKPVQLMEHIIERAPDGVIADPFAGSGSTLLAARNLGRHAIGVELEERYCEIIARRLSQGVLL